MAARHGWKMPPRTRDTWTERLAGIGPFRIGHDRRLSAVYRTRHGVWLFPYACDTGFEHRRGHHVWRLAVYEIAHPYGHAIVTCEDWLIAMLTTPVSHEIEIADGETVERNPNGPVALVEDREAWWSRLHGDLGAWFNAQPAMRSWQTLPGLVVGFEPGPFLENDMDSLADATRELADRLAKK